MRKYYQLILLITSVVSVSLLLIYRHEYNRLRYVLEVFNFFGKPADCSLPDILNSSSLHYDWGPVPVWTSNQDQDVFIYSAYLKNENSAEALIIHKQLIIPFCYLWLEKHNEPIIGSIKYSMLHELNDNNLALYKYECHGDSVPERPYAVSFSTIKSNNLKRIPLNPLVKKKHDFSTICVIPSDTYSKREIVEFLSFHQILGFNTFIIYDNNIPYKFMRTLQKISIKLGLELVSYPWNYPYSNTKLRNIIEEDCLLRTKDKSRNTIILNWNEFIVPRNYETISTLFDYFDPTNKTNRFGIKTLNFCLEDNDKREPSILHSLHYDPLDSTEELFLHRSNSIKNKIINTQEISMNVAAVHRYILCDTSKKYSKTESVMLKFSNLMRKSTLYKLFKYDRL